MAIFDGDSDNYDEVRMVKTTMMEACNQLIDEGGGDDEEGNDDEEGDDEEEGNDDGEGDDDEEGNDEGLWLFDRPFHLWCIN